MYRRRKKCLPSVYQNTVIKKGHKKLCLFFHSFEMFAVNTFYFSGISFNMLISVSAIRE